MSLFARLTCFIDESVLKTKTVTKKSRTMSIIEMIMVMVGIIGELVFVLADTIAEMIYVLVP